MKRAICLIAAGLALLGCNRRGDEGPVIVSVIGDKPSLGDSSHGPLSASSKLLLDATAQGLVRFDEAGQIEPGIAERWIVIDNGMSYIFRLRQATWSDGRPVTATEVATVLRRQVARGSRNPLLPFLSAIAEIVEMTPEIIEVRLRHPRPDLLKLFAQPELAVMRTRPPAGSGPFRVVATEPDGALLRPALDTSQAGGDDVAEPGLQDQVRLIGERAARAIYRFTIRGSDLVTGGTFADWPLLAAVSIAPANKRIDPAAGLFGFAIANRDRFLADVANRAAIARALDRQAIVDSFDSGWAMTNRILPDQLDSAAPPAGANWVEPAAPAPEDAVNAWRQAQGAPPLLRVALPNGPGATIVYAHVAASLARIGIATTRVAAAAPADLRLVDEVAPYDSARWYLATACQPCGAGAQSALEAARESPTMALRAQHIAEADAAMAGDIAFIPIAQPLRWSLVALRLRRWQGNSRAWHPLNHLRNDTN